MQNRSSQLETGAPFDTEGNHLNQLLAALVSFLECGQKGGGNPSQESSEDILLDVDLCGNRYLLIRMGPAENGRVHLSPREREIVRMVAKGHPNKVIADVLNISSWTVCTHLRRIFAKLGVSSRAAMVAHLLETERRMDPAVASEIPGTRPSERVAV